MKRKNNCQFDMKIMGNSQFREDLITLSNGNIIYDKCLLDESYIIGMISKGDSSNIIKFLNSYKLIFGKNILEITSTYNAHENVLKLFESKCKNLKLGCVVCVPGMDSVKSGLYSNYSKSIEFAVKNGSPEILKVIIEKFLLCPIPTSEFDFLKNKQAYRFNQNKDLSSKINILKATYLKIILSESAISKFETKLMVLLHNIIRYDKWYVKDYYFLTTMIILLKGRTELYPVITVDISPKLNEYYKITLLEQLDKMFGLTGRMLNLYEHIIIKIIICLHGDVGFVFLQK